MSDESDESVEIDEQTGRPLSVEFVDARVRAHQADRRHFELNQALRSGDSAVTQQQVDDAHEHWLALANDALRILEEDRGEREREVVREKNEAALSAPWEETLQRALDTLRRKGPMTAAEIEALRLKGLSHNAVRPALQELERRGLVDRVRNGRRAEWHPVP